MNELLKPFMKIAKLPAPVHVVTTGTSTDSDYVMVKKDAPLPKISLQALKKGQQLSEGAFGFVFEGEWRKDKKTKIQVAIKQLRIDATQLTAEEAQAFKNEMAILSQLHHPYVVAFYGIAEEGKASLLVMELCKGGSVLSRLQDKKLVISDEEKCLWFRQLVAGLAYLHGNEIIHGDLAARNILLDENNNAKLADFGLAKIKHYDEAGKTLENSVMMNGALSVAWAAPEIVENASSGNTCKLTKPADMFSLGVTLWEIASRKAPLATMPSMSAKITAVISGNLDAIPEKTPKEIAKAIQKCRQKNPEDRPTAEYLQQQYPLTMFAQSGKSSKNTTTITTSSASEEASSSSALRGRK